MKQILPFAVVIAVIYGMSFHFIVVHYWGLLAQIANTVVTVVVCIVVFRAVFRSRGIL
ncbi:MAG: hypothetical protein WB952_06780 [Terriglobales bacterium]